MLKKEGLTCDEVAEWLRRWTANPLCSARVGSNPILVDWLSLWGVVICFGEVIRNWVTHSVEWSKLIPSIPPTPPPAPPRSRLP